MVAINVILLPECTGEGCGGDNNICTDSRVHHRNAENRAPVTRNHRSAPILGRWLTRDPIGYQGGINLYGYVNSSPVGNVDAAGTMWNGEFTGAAQVLYFVPLFGQVWWAGNKVGDLFAHLEQLGADARQAQQSQLRYEENAANPYSRNVPTGAYCPAMHNTINEAGKAAKAGGSVPGTLSGGPIPVPAETVEKNAAKVVVSTVNHAAGEANN